MEADQHPTAVATANTPPAIASSIELGITRVAVTDLRRSVSFYEQAIGLEHLGGDEGVARMGSGGRTVLELAHEPHARPSGRHAGLFHVALLYPSRLELARVGSRLIARGARIEGASDHGTHEAFYLPDPDGNGLELAADRPRAQWPTVEQVYAGGPQPLDMHGLMEAVAGEPVVEQAAPGVVVGHVHLHVADIDESLRFYRDVVGFDLMARLPTAAFVSAGGYHHHLGINVWQGQGVPPAPADAVGLRYWTVLVPRQEDVDALAERLASHGVAHELGEGGLATRDPSGNTMRVQVGPVLAMEGEASVG